MVKKDKQKTRLVRVEETVAQLVEKHSRPIKQSIGGFFTLAAIEKLEKYKTNKK